MIYHIDYDKDRRKVACPVKNRQELLALRDSEKNLRILREYRSGKTDVKGDLLQLAYNIGHVNGLIAGCKSIGSHFFHDIDCYDKEQSEAYKQLILSKKEEIGLLMMERSPSGGWHLVCQRERGKTILENQVRVATILQIEMDTNAKDLQRVVFSTSGSGDDLPFIDDAIFEEPMTLEESVAEYELLKERERRNLEEVPAGAKKASKHYKPWLDSGERLEVSGESSNDNPNLNLDPNSKPSTLNPQPYPNNYHGISFTDILRKYWELLIRKAFDNSLAGQERVGADSVSGIAPLRWNFNASTTPPNARKFFHKMVNDGTVSRLDISTIIRNDDEDDTAPILGIYDHAFAQELKPYIDRLEAANGLIECAQAKKLSLDIRQENKDAAKLYESEAYRVFSYRANVIAWLKGMVLYVAHGYKWSKEIADFVRWTQQYNLWCKMLYFGQQLEKELREEVEIQRQSGPQNLLELLPDEFTKEQYRQMRRGQGKSGDGDSTLRTWMARNYIAIEETTGNYFKTEAYKKKFGK